VLPWRLVPADETTEAPRLAELIGSLSLATDLAAGFAMETALRTSYVAVELGRAAGLSGEPLRDVYYTGLLRFIGCTAFAHEQAWYGGGDDQAFSRELAPVDGSKPGQVVGTVVRKIGRGAGGLRRVRAVVRTLSDPKGPSRFAAAHCDLAVRLAARLGMSEGVVAALGQIYERWDGKGNPHHVAGGRIELAARLMHVAWRAEVHRGLDGPAAAIEVVRQRAASELDPALAARFAERARELLETTSAPSVWESFLGAEPTPYVRLEPASVGRVAEAFAHFVDIKSPFTLGHSTGVARLARNAAEAVGVPEPERLEIAALLHDLGRVSVPNGIWDKPGPLNPAEWERVRLHAYQTERILSQTPLLAPFAQLAGQHHERPDGSGYHRGLTQLAKAARILCAANAYHAMTEERAYRCAHDPAAAAKLLVEEARAGRQDREAVEAVLVAAGHRAAARVRGGWPAQLSEREVEVLCLLARGLSNKEIGSRLFISAKTVQHHVAHIYQKTGVSTRAAAALFAVENDLVK
jgi:HD-GYP domain-containing protein (c-di-GMP phosphodiesterase class II)